MRREKGGLNDKGIECDPKAGGGNTGSEKVYVGIGRQVGKGDRQPKKSVIGTPDDSLTNF